MFKYIEATAPGRGSPSSLPLSATRRSRCVRPSARQLGHRIVQGLEVIAVEFEEIERRVMILVDEFRLRRPALRGQHDVPNAPIAGHRPALCQAETLQPVHDPRGVRGVTFPIVCERSHRPPDVRIEG